MSINWRRLEGRKKSDDIAAAVAKLPATNPIPTLWPLAKSMPDASAIDFGAGVTKTKVALAGLQASNPTLDRANLIWHLQNLNKSRYPSPLTKRPIVLDTPSGQIILDGQHRLGARKLLGKNKAKVFLCPTGSKA